VTEQGVSLTIDGTQVQVPKDTLLWEAAKNAGIDIPIFCYHSKLGPVGVCRMCMVQVEGMPKLTTACTTLVTEGMVVYTQSPEVEKAQRGVLEFLLINHPLDCPICDRGGECPLQDQTFTYGPGVSRFIEPKRHFLKPIQLGPTITLDRERCILCWRCVRFTSEIAEDDQLILSERGSESYIATFEGEPYVSNFSGNVIELCPVGALTSRKQRFTFRPWELQQHSSICPHCPMGCNIYIDVRDAQEVIRFRSRTNEAVDGGWLCDRGRFGYDFIASPSRVTTPLIRRDGRLQPASWPVAYRFIAENLQRIQREQGNDAVGGIASPRLANEDLFTFKRFMSHVIGSRMVDYWPRPSVDLSNSQQTLLAALEARLAPIDAIDSASLVVIVDADPSERQPVMELRIRNAVNKRGVKLVEIGPRDIPLTEKAAASIRSDSDQLEGALGALTLSGGGRGVESEEFETARSLLKGADSIVVLYDDYFPEVAADARGDTLQALVRFVDAIGASSEVGVIPMLMTSNERAARDFGLIAPNDHGATWGRPLVQRVAAGDLAALILAGADPAPDVEGFASALRKLAFSLVTELELTETATLADVVLPAASFAEKFGSVTNAGRRVQTFSQAIPAPGIARPDWQILVELSQRWDSPLSYSRPEQVLEDIAGAVPAYAGLRGVVGGYSRVGAEGMSAGGAAAE